MAKTKSAWDADWSLVELIELAHLRRKTEPTILEVVERRVASGADVNQGDDGGTTPLLAAAAKGYLSVAKRLSEAGANPAAKNQWKDDLVSCAKLSDNREMLQWARFVLRAWGGAAAEPTLHYWRPKPGTEAEYTFIPTTAFKKMVRSKAADVGFFLRDDEVLALAPVKAVSTKAGVLSVVIEEGVVTLQADRWDSLDEKQCQAAVRKGATVHGIEDITREYLSD